MGEQDDKGLAAGTRVVRAGLPDPREGEPFLPGPVFAGTYHFAGSPDAARFTYGRYDNPTWSNLEAALGELEGGEATVYASGMAAVSAVLLGTLRPGDVLVVPSDGYYTARALASTHLGERGVEVRQGPTAGGAQGRLLEGARLVWLESPSNPGLDVCDLAGLAARAHDAGCMVAVDNTTATPLGQRPLALGADFSVSSDTKALTGHADLVLGHVAVRDRDLGSQLRTWRAMTGAVPGPMEAWLAHRSLATLDLRLERQCRSAQVLAEALAGHPAVRALRYPGLATDPAHALAARQMERFGFLIGLTLDSAEQAERFLSACRLVTAATSFGAVHTSAERRARWGGDEIPDGFIRLSVGCEDTEDLLADLTAGLASAGGA